MGRQLSGYHVTKGTPTVRHRIAPRGMPPRRSASHRHSHHLFRCYGVCGMEIRTCREITHREQRAGNNDAITSCAGPSSACSAPAFIRSARGAVFSGACHVDILLKRNTGRAAGTQEPFDRLLEGRRELLIPPPISRGKSACNPLQPSAGLATILLNRSDSGVRTASTPVGIGQRPSGKIALHANRSPCPFVGSTISPRAVRCVGSKCGRAAARMRRKHLAGNSGASGRTRVCIRRLRSNRRNLHAHRCTESASSRTAPRLLGERCNSP